MYIAKTKVEFEKYFRAEYLPSIKEYEKKYTKGSDPILRREEWNNIIDSLVRDRSLPEKAIDWSAPW